MCGSRGPRLLPCFQLSVWTSRIVNHGWVAKVPANPDVKKAWDESSAYHVLTKKKRKQKKKTCTDMPIFIFYWHIVFLCPLVFRKYVKCPHVPIVSFAFLCNGSVFLMCGDIQWCYQCQHGDLGWQWLFLTAFPELWETAFPVHMRLLIKGIFLPVLCGVCSVPVETPSWVFFF